MDILTPADIAWAASAIAAIHADMESTKRAQRRGAVEVSPLYGTPHPSDSSLDTAGLLGSGAVLGGAVMAPKRWRRPLLAGVTGFEAALAAQNEAAGRGGKPMGFAESVQAPLAAGALAVLAAHILDSVDVTPYIELSGKSPAYGFSISKRF